MALQQVDTTTLQPNGKRGDPAKTAWEKTNANTTEIDARLVANVGSINAEALSRQNADGVLADAIAAETSARGTAIAAEVSARETAIAGEVTLRTAADNALSAAITAAVQRTGRNYIINGGFDIWQRSNSSANSGYSSVDRFVNNINGGSQTLSRVAITPGGFPAGVHTPTYVLSATYTGASAAPNYNAIQYRIENVNQFSGRTITFSMWIRSATVGQKVAIEFMTDPGTGGSISGQSNNIGTTTFTIAAANTWQYVTTTVVLPSLAAATLGPVETTSLRFNLWLSSGTDNAGRNNAIGVQSGSMLFAMLQLEAGNVATAFEVIPVSETLLRCQRYYEKSYPVNTNPGAITAAGIAQHSISGLPSGSYTVILTAQFKVEKRVVPTVTWYSPTTGTAGTLRSYTGGNDITANFPNIGTSCAQINGALTSAAASFNIGGQWSADAEI